MATHGGLVIPPFVLLNPQLGQKSGTGIETPPPEGAPEMNFSEETNSQLLAVLLDF
jgi:hypothetical protein